MFVKQSSDSMAPVNQLANPAQTNAMLAANRSRIAAPSKSG
jgi:hypothetical protein